MVELKVEGMSCQHCVASVTKAVRAVDEHASVRVDLAEGRVSVDTAVPRDALSAAIEDAGYTVAA
ncbi:heavy-metal-associated domain-containing protein [Pararobbsia silviterrae]|uniref:Copper chaperone n=1 Tax=Pararobbsia silviterrae TaxID=1792498 RepID=A0A494Y7K2_9BURK|nr:cation transporter [Pararobbsia silviterrae]RKP57537.1 copper chaperone [Pararobbsia silviterrae]